MNPFETPGEIAFSVIFAPLEIASGLFSARLGRHGESIRIRKQWSPESAPYLFSNFVKGSREQILWSPVDSSITVFCQNVGYAGSNDIRLLSESCKVRVAYVAVHDGDAYPYYNAFFWLYEDAMKKRGIQAALAEDGWQYFQSGEIQFFEDPTYSRRKKIRDRLNREILREYLLKLGVDVRSDDFWNTSVEPHYFVDGWTVQHLNLEKHGPPT